MADQLTFRTEEELRAALAVAGVALEIWGQGSAKTVAHLFREIASEEAVLTRDGDGLVRRTEYVAVTLTYRGGDGIRELCEDRQEFTDGRIRRREIGDGSLYEKMRSNEHPEDAARRAIREELNLAGDVLLRATGKSEGARESASYPGLRTRYTRHDFSGEISPEQFRPDGYIEKQSDKTTFFVWRRKGYEGS